MTLVWQKKTSLSSNDALSYRDPVSVKYLLLCLFSCILLLTLAVWATIQTQPLNISSLQAILSIPLLIAILSFIYLAIKQRLEEASVVLLSSLVTYSILCAITLNSGSLITIALLYSSILTVGVLFNSKSILAVAAIALLVSTADTYTYATKTLNHTGQSNHTNISVVYPVGVLILSLGSWVSARQREGAYGAIIHPRAADVNEFTLIGQTAATMIHDISNHLSILNLDINDLPVSSKSSESLHSAKLVINQINNLIHQTRDHIVHRNKTVTFSVSHAVDQAISQSRLKNRSSAKCTLTINNPGNELVTGSLTVFIQILTILIDNALHSCSYSKKPEILIQVTRDKGALYVSVKDNGAGVSRENIRSLFLPKESSKIGSLGIGLYLASQLTSSYFKGSLTHKNLAVGAQFTINLPIRGKA